MKSSCSQKQQKDTGAWCLRTVSEQWQNTLFVTARKEKQRQGQPIATVKDALPPLTLRVPERHRGRKRVLQEDYLKKVMIEIIKNIYIILVRGKLV
jgi:hypothetical protein